MYYVYTLSDPRTCVVKYVGATIDPEARFRSHMGNISGRASKRAWIDNLKTSGLMPILEVVAQYETKEDAAIGEQEAYNAQDKKGLLCSDPNKTQYKYHSQNKRENGTLKARSVVVTFRSEQEKEEYIEYAREVQGLKLIHLIRMLLRHDQLDRRKRRKYIVPQSKSPQSNICAAVTYNGMQWVALSVGLANIE